MEINKKILLISNMYPSVKEKYYGIFVKNVEELLIHNGYIVDKVVLTKKKNKIVKLFCYVIFHLKVIFKGLFGNYEFLYVHFVSHSSLGAVLVKRIKKKVKLILNCHGNDVVADTDMDFKNIKRSKKYLSYGDYIVVPSNYFKNALKRNYQIPDNKLFVYPSGGVDTNRFCSQDKKESKKLCNLNKEKNYIGYISRIEKDKGWDTYLYMIKELAEENMISKYNYKFLLIGSGEEELELFSLIKELKIEKYIDYRKMVSQDELVHFYNSLDLFVFPTRRKSDSLGLVGLEAMSCETLVITGDNYGPTDYIKDKVNGFTFSSEDYHDLKNKILEIEELNNQEKEKIRINARKTALEYDINKTKNKILEVFQ